MTTTTKAAANGSAQPAPAPARLSGMARVQEGEAWRLASTMHDAAFEAERLCNDIYRTVSDAYQPQGVSTAAEVAASSTTRDRAREARRCLHAAVNFLNSLIGDGEPPF
jgi:hypothetical protein